MRAASRESYAAALDRLEAHARIASAPELATIAGEILEVAVLLGREPGLRRALSDANRGGDERTGLLTGLLSGKVGDNTLALLGELAAGHWSRPNDLVTATERLGAEALLASAELGGTLGEVEDELFRLGQVVAGDSRLASAIGDSTTDLSRRVELVRDLIRSKASPVTTQLAGLAVSGFDARNFDSSIARLVELAAERQNRSVAYVTVAVALDEVQEQRLVAELSRRYGREITTKVTVDSKVLGGISVRIGHDLYDGTISRRLTDTRNALAGRT